MGATVRVAAAAGAAGVVTTGRHDPWGPDALRGGAGLQFAVPVARAEQLDQWRGPLLAVHPEGDALAPGAIPDDAILAFGSERRGLSADLLGRADGRIAIPMEPGVSSLNLATSAAVVLYTWRLAMTAAGVPRPNPRLSTVERRGARRPVWVAPSASPPCADAGRANAL